MILKNSYLYLRKSLNSKTLFNPTSEKEVRKKETLIKVLKTMNVSQEFIDFF